MAASKTKSISVAPRSVAPENQEKKKGNLKKDRVLSCVYCLHITARGNRCRYPISLRTGVQGCFLCW